MHCRRIAQSRAASELWLQHKTSLNKHIQNYHQKNCPENTITPFFLYFFLVFWSTCPSPLTDLVWKIRISINQDVLLLRVISMCMKPVRFSSRAQYEVKWITICTGCTLVSNTRRHKTFRAGVFSNLFCHFHPPKPDSTWFENPTSWTSPCALPQTGETSKEQHTECHGSP